MPKRLHVLAACVLLPLAALARADDCRPAPPEVARLVPVVPGYFSVGGPLAEFDPCHRSVEFRKPLFSSDAPLMIVVHGGAGIDGATRSAVSAFARAGFATLVFDAFELNGFQQGPAFWSTSATNEARQRMILKAAWGAYEWARRQEGIDNRRIVLHGLSNGGPAVLNVAASADPAHVRGVLAEGTPGMGVGLPGALRVPVRLVYGRLDNYGGETEGDWMWTRQDACRINRMLSRQAPGTASDCNWQARPQESTVRPIDWYEARKAEGADIELVWLDDTAHGAFAGPLTRRTVQYTSGKLRMAWVGGTQAARDTLVRLAEALVKPR